MPGTEIYERLNKVLETIQAGMGAVNSKTKKELFQTLNDSLRETLKEDLFRQHPDLKSQWNEIFETSAENQVALEIGKKVGLESFFQFGEYLIKSTAGHDTTAIRLMHSYLDIVRQSSLMQRLGDTKKWEKLVYKLIEKSNFNVLQLYKQRHKDYPNKVLFKVLYAASETTYTWNQVDDYVQRYSYGLAKLAVASDESVSKIAFLMENSIEMVFLDLACLTSGIVNVMIPANSVPQQVEFVLNQTQAPVIMVYDDKQLAKIKAIKDKLPHLKTAVLIKGSSIDDWVISLQEMIDGGMDFSEEAIIRLRQSIKIDSLASLMYTSGTTGEPKGIMFSHMNIVYKRFCRAMALPETSDRDRYLAYLPLYHTFGRWLEMMGSLFWGAEYAFMENPAMATMIDNMQRVKPTIFISIPKKWYQLYEYAGSKINVELAADDEIREIVKEATGGELKWGLSAAGYLEPDIFKFFQRNGIELMSGFGMTEATGGITMTYPGQYVENSLGKALPGIEIKLGEDGEMMIKGSYVMMGYYGLKKGQSAFTDGWFPTGDIMRIDRNGFYEIIDRKKEIYKNIKGETIAPQKIENLFRDFEYVEQVFLVGDHRQYNTVLIYPNYQSGEDNLIVKMSAEEKQSYFSTVVVTVNKFLAPFERIIDFRLIDHPFIAEKGELTPKGTYKRRVIEKNFDKLIETMYTRNYISLFWEDMELRIPNWFLREIGCLTHDLKITADGLKLAKHKRRLTLRKDNGKNERLQIGDYFYINKRKYVDLQIFFANPFYWLGNEALLHFAGESIFQWYRIDEPDEQISFAGVVASKPVPAIVGRNLTEMLEGGEKSLFGLNLAVRHLQSSNYQQAELAIQYLELILNDDSLPFYTLALEIISHPEYSDSIAIQRDMFKLGAQVFKDRLFEGFLERYIKQTPNILNDELTDTICKTSRGDDILGSIHAVIKTILPDVLAHGNIKKTAMPSLLNLAAVYGINHPTKYKRVRQLIVRYQLRKDCKGLSEVATAARQVLLRGFRDWLGTNQSVSVDVETGNEYRWKDVVIFEETIPEADRRRILKAIEETALLREAIFLFSGGNMVRLYDIPLGGVWISVINDESDKSVYRVSVQTRYQGAYDIALNLNRQEFVPEIKDEINWLIHAGAPAKGLKLLEDFGGFWIDYNIWTDEYLPGDKVSKFFERSFRRKSEEADSRFYHLWPFFVWTGMAAHVSFYRRTGYKMELEDKSIDNIIIPPHDYQTGVRILSIARRIKADGLLNLIMRFHSQFVEETEEKYPFLKRDYICNYMFSGILDTEGENKGREMLEDVLSELRQNVQDERSKRMEKVLVEFLEQVKTNRFIPKKLFFAIKRFYRWHDLNKDANLSAQARTLNELYDAYQLQDLEKKNPETRTRFYIATVFLDSSDKFLKALNDIMRKLHDDHLSHEQTLALISNLQKEIELSEKEKFFLSRLSYPHIRPTDSAVLVSTLSEGSSMADVVVRLEDYDGLHYLVRKPVSPKEISRLHQLFIETNLPVHFRPEHRFIVALSERGHVIGGLFYNYIDKETAYMEKIVVSGHFRRKGISEGLMHEFFNRLRDEKIKFVTTGFFRPEYFYRFGFKIERKYAGLVKDLSEKQSAIQEEMGEVVR